MTLHETVMLVLALICGYFCGQSFGYKDATRDYKGAIDQACEDYRESVRTITKLRNRLAAQRWLKVRTERNKRSALTQGDNRG